MGTEHSRLPFVTGVVAFAALYFACFSDAAAQDTDYLPTDLSHHDHADLARLNDAVHSPFARQADFDGLARSVSQSIRSVDELLAGLTHVADMQTPEVQDLLQQKQVLVEAQQALGAMDTGHALAVMKAQGFSPAHIAHKAAELAKIVPNIDEVQLTNTYQRLAQMYDNTSYGEVLHADSTGHLRKDLFSDVISVKGDTSVPSLDPLEQLARIPEKSALMPPALNHHTLSVLTATGSPEKWFVSSGAFEVGADHKTDSCHIAPVDQLQCVDVALLKDKTNPVEIGKFLIAAIHDPAVSFVQFEVGKDGSVTDLQHALTAVWKGKVDDGTLARMNAMIVKNGAGFHGHIKFKIPYFSKKLSMVE
jgi:hypothetical protein